MNENVSREHYESLLAAIYERAYLDYEILISDRPDMHMPADVTKTEIELFTGRKVLDKIDEAYAEFRELVSAHAKEIIDEWDSPRIKKIRRNSMKAWGQLKTEMTYHCPLCGGFLYPGHKRRGAEGYIVCSYCALNMRIPKEYRKCII